MLSIVPKPPGGPVIQTLARFGRDSNCRGIAADAAGNIYLALIEHPYHDASCALLLQLTADTYKIVQLARITVQESGGDSPSGLTVAPDGQQIYMGMEDGRVLRLWLHTDDDGMWELCLKTSKVQRVMTEGVSSLVMGPNLGGQLCGYGILGDDIVCAQMGPDGSIASCTPLVIKWPEGFGDGRWSTQILGCSMDGSLLIAAGIGDSDDESDEDENEEEEEEEDSEDGDPVTLSVIFHVTAAGKATVVVGSAEGVGDDSDNDSNSHQENRDQGSEHSSSDSDGSEEPVDVWEGMTIAEGVTCVPENFYDWTLDASGAIIGFTCTGHVIRVELAQPLIPAHLQAESAANRDKKPGINFESCRAAQLRADWGDLLASGEGADVQLRCAEGAVVKAHALVLLARWEYYRVLQRSIAAGMTGGRAPGEVDVSEHSAATVQLILQHLYTGRVQLLGAHSTHHTLGNGNNSSSSSSTRSDGPAGAGGRGNQEVESAAAANSSGASSQESEATTEAVPGGACSTGGLLEMQQCGASGPPSKHLQCDCGSQSGPSEQQSLLLGQHLAQLVPLARAADALLLPDLRDACLKVAQQELAPGNALPLLLAAHEAQVSPLQTAALEYTLNHIKEVYTCKTSPVTIRDIIKSAPDLGAELADGLAAALASQ